MMCRPFLFARSSALFLLTSTALVLTGCSTKVKPLSSTTMTKASYSAPVVQYGATPGYGSGGVHTVLAGDNLWTIAKQYKLPLRDIIDANNLAPPYRLAVGTRLRLPPPQTYKVKTGDSLPLVAQVFSVSQSELIALNNISAPFRLLIGQDLRLPRPQRSEPPAAAAPIVALNSAAGDVLNTAPQASSDVIQVERLSDPQQGASQQLGSYTVASTQSVTDLRPPVTAQIAPTQPEPAVAQMLDIPPRQGGRFLQPVSGSYVSRYGPKAGGLYNEGVNIAAPRGTPVRAAENGTIVYVGRAVEGYGNLVLVKHADNYITAYAHLDKTLAKQGQVVKRGQPIATVGSTGNVDRPQLHFEVRKGRDPVDPATMI